MSALKKTEMTPRERVTATLNHQEPDRVPIDLGQATGDGITLGAYRNLLRHLGMDASRIQVKDKRGQTARVDEEVLRRFRVDVRGMGLGSPENWKDVWLDDQTYQDEWGVVRTMPAGALYYDLLRAPFAEEATVSAIERYGWPRPSRLRRLRSRARGRFRPRTPGCQGHQRED